MKKDNGMIISQASLFKTSYPGLVLGAPAHRKGPRGRLLSAPFILSHSEVPFALFPHCLLGPGPTFPMICQMRATHSFDTSVPGARPCDEGRELRGEEERGSAFKALRAQRKRQHQPRGRTAGPDAASGRAPRTPGRRCQQLCPSDAGSSVGRGGLARS